MWSLLIAVQLLAVCSLAQGSEAETESLKTWVSNKGVHLDCGCSVIQIRAVSYGWRDNTCSCRKPSNNPSNTNCSASISLSEVKERCERKTRCSLMVSNGPDPCLDTCKYLNISYTCVPPKCQDNDGYLQYGDLLFVRKPMSWVEALRHCAESPGSRLVHILDDYTQTRVEELLAEAVSYWGCMEKVWVGLERCMINPQAPWEWSGGAAVGDYKHWISSFPRDSCCFHCGQLVQEGQGEECLWQAGEKNPKYLWQDACCQEQHPFICQLTSSVNNTHICQSSIHTIPMNLQLTN